jgi:hypothetical protein
MIAAVACLLSLVHQSTIAPINGRTPTWDRAGIVPLELVQKPSEGQLKLFEELRQGHFDEASSGARAHLKRQPNDVIDVWILIECARVETQVGDMASRAEAIYRLSPTPATNLLRLRARDLAYQRKPKTKAVTDAYFAETEPMAKSLRDETNPAILLMLMSSRDAEVEWNRKSAQKLMQGFPDVPEYGLTFVFTLIRVRVSTIKLFGQVTTQRDKGPKLETAPPKLLLVSPALEFDEALRCLADLQKRFKDHPLISNFRSLVYAGQEMLADPVQGQVFSPYDKMDRAELKRQARASAEEFVDQGDAYPGQVRNARSYLDTGSYGTYYSVSSRG